MQIRVKLYGWFKIGLDDPEGLVELTLPEGTDVAGVVHALADSSSMLDPRSCLVMIEGTRVGLERSLTDGEEMHIYPIFSGG